YKAFASPATLTFRNLFKILQNAALEMVDFLESTRQHIGACLLAANPACAIHRDPAVLSMIEVLRGEILELPETGELRIDRAFEAAHGNLEVVADIEEKRAWRGDQFIPVLRVDIDADRAGRIGRGIAKRDDLLLQTDLEPGKRHRPGGRK